MHSPRWSIHLPWRFGPLELKSPLEVILLWWIILPHCNQIDLQTKEDLWKFFRLGKMNSCHSKNNPWRFISLYHSNSKLKIKLWIVVIDSTINGKRQSDEVSILSSLLQSKHSKNYLTCITNHIYIQHTTLYYFWLILP